jgi:peptidoglycan/LPS O-acetylase OafA/YrhL
MSRAPAATAIAVLILAIALAPYAFRLVEAWRARRHHDHRRPPDAPRP